MSAVICTYTEDRWALLSVAVASLQAQRHAPAEIIVVVDHNPSLLDRVHRELAGVVAIENREQRGLSGGRNSAVAVATSPIVAFLDDDAEAHPEWLSRLGAHFVDPDVVGVGGLVVPAWATGRPGWFPREFDWVVGCTYEGMPTSLTAVRNPFGGAMAIRRRALEVAGGYRTDLGRIGKHPLGCEETELCLRVRRHWPDAVFLFEPAAQILHHVPAERARWRYFRRRCYAEGLSKSVVRASAAAGSLATEWSYTMRTLPRGVCRALLSALRGDGGGLGRAGAILGGLAWTTAGYAAGTFSQLGPRRSPAEVQR